MHRILLVVPTQPDPVHEKIQASLRDTAHAPNFACCAHTTGPRSRKDTSKSQRYGPCTEFCLLCPHNRTPFTKRYKQVSEIRPMHRILLVVPTQPDPVHEKIQASL